MFTLQNYRSKKNELVATSIFIVVCLVLSVVFPTKNDFQGMSKGIFFFFVFPLLFVKYILGKKVRDYGLNVKKKKTGVIWGAIMLILSFAILYLFANYTALVDNYKFSQLTIDNFWVFLFNMLFFVNIILFNQEFFFRGFVFSTFLSRYGLGAVLIQAGLYNLALIIGVGGFNKDLWQFVPFMILSVTSGVTAYMSRSIIFSWLGGLVFLILANAYIIHMLKLG